MSTWHISEDNIDLYAIGALEGEALAEVEEHLLTCPECQARLLEMDEFIEVFRVAAVQPGARSVARSWSLWQRRTLVWATATAGVVLVAVLAAPKETGINVPPVIVELQSLRGPEVSARVPVGRSALLRFDVLPQTAPGNYEIEVVDAGGFPVLTTNAEVRDGKLTATIAKLTGGSYWVRVYTPRPVRDLVAEYGLIAG
jgi:hypothetical protein